ncbi:LuxR C-terminal-related transcriptional regulator [Bacillus horti]|uniref:LuxR family maltose regulon positive regulatory protein n=1 Tax=Caldalkalibacillus horti TaxID=77523 RepID=A0ABT9W215_9BACI|nr:LuxR C-terminal-related transcriptional regulator [Bacillus horti]MDQ0167281.1 LuxR family maltose regulon positive regulatory protein [Bacillus horti]
MSNAKQHENLVLKSKLFRPQQPEQAIQRLSLIAHLNEGLKRKATFVIAPAGYGKTTLISNWTKQLDRSNGWLSLDSRDNDIARFWLYVCAAIHHAEPDFLEDTLSSDMVSSSLVSGHVEPFLVRLLNQLEEMSRHIVLVLDDWHVIDDQRIVDSMSFFIEYLPSNVHICFISRKSPEGLKARWLSRGWVNKLEADSLRFNLQEATAFFHKHNLVELSHDQIQSLLYKTEGWVTGLKLAVIAINGKVKDQLFHALEAPQVHAENFLAEEVFESLSESERKMLMKLSLLQRFNHELCAWMSQNDLEAPSLQKLIDSNLFLVSLDDHNQWYRLHHWFKAFLRRQLIDYDPRAETSLYGLAGAWCEQQGLKEDAVEYYLAGKHYEEAIRLLEEMKSFMIRRQFSTLRKWLSMLPEAILQSHHYLYFSFVFSLLWDNRPDVAEEYLLRAERILEEEAHSWSSAERNRYAGDLYFVRNFKSTQFDMDMVKGLEYIRLSLMHSPTGTDLIFASPYLPLAPSIYRSYNGKRGRHLPREIADTFFQSMIAFMKQMGIEEAIEVCYGELLYERNELKKAEEYLKKGLTKSIRTRHEPEKVFVPALLFLSRISVANHNVIAAVRWLEMAKEKVLENSSAMKEALIFIEAELALLKLDEGDTLLALQWKSKYRLSHQDAVSVDQLYNYQALARILVASNELRAAWNLLKRLWEIALKDHRPMDALAIQILQAVLQKRMGNHEEAILLIEGALIHAEPDDYIRVFVDQGLSVAELLGEYIQMRQKGLLRDRSIPSLRYVRRVLSSFADQGITLSASEDSLDTLEVLLTNRELSVYRCMEEGLDNQAITERLGIGMGTLKSHINHIYSKLQVSSRVEAIRRGRELRGV